MFGRGFSAAVVCSVVLFGCGRTNDSSTGPGDSPNRTLTITVGKGVIAEPSSGPIRSGTTVNYRFQVSSGYDHLKVKLDGADVSASGSLMMTANHMLAATADTIVSLTALDSVAIVTARQILTASDPARTLASQLESSWNDEAARGTDAAAATLDRVAIYGFSAQADAAALAAVTAKLSGKTFTLDLGDLGAASTMERASAEVQLPMTIIFINGIATTPNGLIPDVFWVRNTIAHAALPDYNKANYRLIWKYNATGSQRYPDAGFCLFSSVSEGLARRLGVFSIIDFMNSYCGITSDLTRGLLQILDLLSWVPSTNPDATDLAQMVLAERRTGRGVILLGHSQGTLIAQEAMKQLTAGSTDPGLSIQKCTGLVSLAGPAPDRVKFLHQTNFYDQGLVTKDIILNLSTANKFPGVVTNQAAEADGDATFWKSLGVPDVVTTVFAGIRLHRLVESYLRATPLRDLIQRSLRDQIAAIGADCAPAAATLRIVTQPSGTAVGTTLVPAPSVEIRDAEGNRVGSSSVPVTVAAAGSSATLTGTKTVQAINGVATFSDLQFTASGTYQLTFSSPGLTGTASTPFTISPPPCLATNVPLPFSVTGDLRTSQCTFINAIALPYNFSTAVQRSVRMRLSGNAFIPRISVFTRDLSQSQSYSGSVAGSTASQVYLLTPGSYTAAAGNEGGPLSPFVFEGTIINESTTGCESVTMLRPSLLTTSQSLSSGDCNEGGYWADVFVIGGSGACSITMRSAAFDAWLDVYDRNHNLITSNDDGAGGSDALVTLDPCYVGSDSNFIFDVLVHATSYNSGATGPYTLEFRFNLGSTSRSQLSTTERNIDELLPSQLSDPSMQRVAQPTSRPPKRR